MENSSQKDLFKDYYFNNKGTIYKSFEIKINSFNYNYDIYWGDPNIIFDKKNLRETFPLAVTTIPHRNNYPNPRIYLHEKLEKKYNDIFEMVIAHEIGHLWLHDVVGFNNPSTNYFMEEKESEIWADFFSYCFFVKYRKIDNLDKFNKILEKANNLQIEIYNLKPEQYIKLTLTKKIECLKILKEKINLVENPKITHMKKAIEISLNSLGDIFK